MRKFMIVASVILWILISVACGDPSSENHREDPAVEAPMFRVRTFDQTNFSLAEHRGTPVVINFWESW